jgi:outer membrane protein
MKKITFFIIVLSLFAFKTEGADLKIGYVDLNKALFESNKGKRATKILDDMLNSKKAVVLKKEKEIKKLEQELDIQDSILNPKSRKDKKDQLDKLYRDYRRMGKDFQGELQKKEAELTQEIQKDLIEVVNKIGEKEGYSIIFERRVSGMLYSQKKFDITEKVIKKYNEIANAKK